MTTSVDVPTPVSQKPKKTKQKSLRSGEGIKGLALVSPTVLLLAVVIIYPLIKAIILSFQKDAGLDKATGMFVQGGNAGLSNYKHWLLQQCGNVTCPPGSLGAMFYDSFKVTLFWTVGTVLLETIIGMWFAMVMNGTFKGRGLVRAAILVPWAIPTAVTAKLFYFMFAYDGIINHLIGLVGINPILWTGQEWTANFAVLIADVWKTTPFMALLILAGLQLIPGDVYEASALDGASKVQTFFRITLPLVKTPLMVAVLFRTLDVLRIYDLPAILTGGANGTTSMSMLVVAQIREGFHSASALSTIIFLIIAFTAFLFIQFGGADVVQRPPKAVKADKDDADQTTTKIDAANITANTIGGKR